MTDNLELYKKYRPTSFSEVVGQKMVLTQLADMGKRNEIPHTLLLCGASGTGKTTIARILRTKLRCGDCDFHELNCAESRGIDDIRDIANNMNLSPMGGRCRVYLLDEVQKLTSDAFSALLKILEDTPRHVYFILCTTDPQKILKTVRSRCTELVFEPLSTDEVCTLVAGVAEKEGKPVPRSVVQKIAETSEGSARKALVTLHAVIGLSSEATQLAAISGVDADDPQLKQVCQKLLYGGAPWSFYQQFFKEWKEDSEKTRYAILGYFQAVILNEKDSKKLHRANQILCEFRDDTYSCKMSGIISSCYRLSNE